MLRTIIYFYVNIILDFPITYIVLCQSEWTCLHKTLNMVFIKSNKNTYPKARALMQMYRVVPQTKITYCINGLQMCSYFFDINYVVVVVLVDDVIVTVVVENKDDYEKDDDVDYYAKTDCGLYDDYDSNNYSWVKGHAPTSTVMFCS